MNEQQNENTECAQTPVQTLNEIKKLFTTQKLNDEGIDKFKDITAGFEQLAGALRGFVTDPRCFAIVKTKLEEACFYAKKGMCLDPKNQYTVEGK